MGRTLARSLRHRESTTVLMLLAVVFAIWLREPRILDPRSLSSVLLWLPLLLVAALGQMLVIVSRGVDVSVGSILALSAMTAGLALKGAQDLPLGVAAGIACGTGLLLGSMNGALVVLGRVPPILATLGTLAAFRGLTFIVSKGEQVDSNHIPASLAAWCVEGPFSVAGIVVTWALLTSLAVALAAHVVLTRTRAGISLYAAGGNEEAARLSGIAVGRVRFGAYALCGMLAGLAGLLYMSRFRFVNPGVVGQGFELTVIAAAVIGGTNILGGSGTVPGVLVGCVLLATINVALAVMGIDATWQLAAYGAVILVAVLLEAVLRGGERSAR
jgi:rhamnose transport system permease protein